MKKVYEPINFLHAKVFQHKILVPIKNKLFIYNESYNKDSVITTEDDILNFHPITNDKVVILGKTNKTIWHYNMRGELVNKYVHVKKMTNSFNITEDNVDYLFFSDKVGEIYLKELNNFEEKAKIIHGHADPIEFLAVSPSLNTMLSSDTFGKVKICEFPNVFNVISDLLYKNEDIKFCDFLNANQVILVDSENEMHLWDLNVYEITEKLSLRQLASEENLKIVSIFLFAKKFICLDCSEFYLIIEVNYDNKFNLVHRENKMNKSVRSYPLYDGKLKIMEVNEDGDLINSISRDI